MTDKHDRLWAPWRVEYVTGQRPSGCVFCQKLASEDDATNHVLYRGQHNAVLLNTYPYNSGHLLVLPYVHVADLLELPQETRADMMALAAVAARALKQVFHYDGLNLGMNIGEAAGAGISEHVHLHLVPRWNGDTNFMATLAGTRVVPQSLDDTFELLAPALQEAAAEEIAEGRE